MKYFPFKIEKKWQKKWLAEKIYEPDFLAPLEVGRRGRPPMFTPLEEVPLTGQERIGLLTGETAKKPFYNLMMFPYPSAEGLHVGNMYAFTGADIYGRFMRMRGLDVFEPIGLDGFGIHSENFAIKVGKHPAEQAKISEKNFYRQLKTIGNGFAWREKLETYDPEYYKWTQWIFVQMFKRGLAYRKKQAVNWCPGCKTVLADEQVVSGECERCSTKVIKKELEQWFFKITDYAERLLQNLEKMDWSERVKIAQKNWIGKSEGALIKFPISNFQFPIKDLDFVFIHGYKGDSRDIFWPWFRKEVERRGAKVFAPDLPNSDAPNINEQVQYVLKQHSFSEKTIIVTHSLGGVVAMKLLPLLHDKIERLLLIAPPLRTEFLDGKKRPALDDACDWKFNFNEIKKHARNISILADTKDHVVSMDQLVEIAGQLNAKLRKTVANAPHFREIVEPEILKELFPEIEIFTTRPDTIFGATYLVLSPEHQLIKNFQFSIFNFQEVRKYIENAKTKTEEERIVEGKDPSMGLGQEKTGVELKGIKAINPASGEEIPVWVADYVLGGVGTGAIMAVPAHDQRDWEFAQKYNLPIKMVVCPHYPAKTCPVLDSAYDGVGHLVDSGKFNGMSSEQAKWEITKFVGGTRKVQYRLRDWLISRQRYWGPPIPMINCEKCGWQSVPEDDLPVKLPYIKNFRPTGTDKSPLATVEKFYKVRCPKCQSWAKRETDVSDTFLDSAWYYLGYLILGAKKSKDKSKKFTFDKSLIKKWLPVHMYIGGAEHSVLHLLYSRFIAMAFKDWGLTHFEEPFTKFRAHGLLIKDGAKMSKSKGNVVNPDEYIRVYGADALRMYLMFLGPFEQGGNFRDDGIRGITRFLERVWKLIFNFQFSIFNKFSNLKNKNYKLNRQVHKAIKKVTEDIENLQYNTAISTLMILLNAFEENKEEVTKEHILIFLHLLAPFAPHITEELYQQALSVKRLAFRSVHKEKWPECDPKLIQEDAFELVVQINGKVRDKFEAPIDISEAEATILTLGRERVKSIVGTLKPRKVIFVPKRLINIVV